MSVNKLTILGHAEHYFVSNMSVSGSTITFSGSGRIANTSVTVPETTFTHSVNPFGLTLMGLVVLDKKNESISLMIDECVNDGIDRPYMTNPDPNFQILEIVFIGHVPASASSLEGVLFEHHQIELYQVEPSTN